MIFIGLMLLISQGISFLLVSNSTSDQVVEEATQDLTFSKSIVQGAIDQLIAQVQAANDVTLRDFTVKQYLADDDVETKASVIRNVVGRTRADWGAYAPFEGKLEAKTDNTPIETGVDAPFPELIDAAEFSEDGIAYGVKLLNDEVHLVTVVAVDFPRTLGYTYIGNRLDQAFVDSLPEQMPIDAKVTLFSLYDSRPIASHLPIDIARNLIVDTSMANSDLDEIKVRDFDGEEYATTFLKLTAEDSATPIVVSLSYSLDAALARSRALFISLAGLFAVALAFALFGAFLYSRQLTRPIEKLTKAAHAVREGNYDALQANHQKDEFGVLTRSFETMILRVKSREEELSYRARFDVETGLAKREEFLGATAKYSEDHGTSLVIIMELMSFDPTQYTFGHNAGVALINSLVSRVGSFDQGEGAMARLSNKRFAKILKLGHHTADDLLKKFSEHIFSEPVEYEGNRIDMQGAVAYSVEASPIDSEAALSRAEAALFRATDTGQLLVCFDESKDEPDSDRLTLMADMREGLKREDEFQLFVQPKIDLVTRKTVEGEGLIRWFHKERGFMPPDHFISIAEQSGHINLLSDWVIDRAINIVSDWRSRGIDTILAINLSAHDLKDETLPTRYIKKLTSNKLKPADIMLEITESAIMDNPEGAIAVMQTFRELGVHLAIDDFGTGYSSLEYLRRLPVHEVKIDRSFISDIATSEDSRVIARAAIDLAKGLGLKVTAEGVEDEPTLDILSELGCDTAQGYFIAKPMKVTEFSEFLTTSQFGVAETNIAQLPTKKKL
jgi:predicted signal transduction protein with EAL and GGDEF domain